MTLAASQTQRIKIRQLQCFLEVARQHSVVRAAEALSVTQPAVSKTLRELEATLGVKLFDRSGRSVTLTAFGEVFLRHAGASLTALRQGVDSIAQVRDKGTIPITVGALPTVAARVMPRAIQAMKAGGLETVVCVVTGHNADLLAKLRVGELDLVVGRLAAPGLMTGLAFEHLYSERVCLLVRPGHPLLEPAPFDIGRIAGFTVLLPIEGSIIRPAVDRLLIANGIASLPDRIETVSTAFGRGYARSSDAVWIISRGVAADDIDAGALVELPVDTGETLGAVGLTTRADTPPAPATELLMQAVRGVSPGWDSP